MIPDLNNFHDDPNMTFLDVTWQDDDGHSALMLAANEDRQNHVKMILAIATRSGKLSQVLDMRNNEGLTAIELARSNGNTVCEKLIEAYSQIQTRDRRPSRSNSRTSLVGRAGSLNFEDEANENDIQIELVPSTAPQNFRLTRDKISNNTRRMPPHRDMRMRRSRSSQSRLFISHQRTISTDSLPTPPPVQTPPIGLISTIKEGFMSLVGKKDDPKQKEREELATRLRYPIEKDRKALNESFDDSATSFLRSQPAGDTLPSFRKDEQEKDNAFRSSPWGQDESGQPQPQNIAGVRLPPLLSMRRRAGSDTMKTSVGVGAYLEKRLPAKEEEVQVEGEIPKQVLENLRDVLWMA
ncbi:unnamed protein product, partial [Mesorhabditis belari]|uniref:Ankyrin repeat protein n=1 Tax=Mesorhabditis belari TaxID=2138241 RepID=A0AAF3FGK9_9BILA